MKLPIIKSTIIAGGLALGASSAYAGDALTVVSWGGAYTKSQIEAYHKPYTAKYGTKIQSEDYNGGLAEIRAQVEAGKITWDVVDLEVSDAARGCDDGLFEKISAGSLPNGVNGALPSNRDNSTLFQRITRMVIRDLNDKIIIFANIHSTSNMVAEVY